MHNVPARAAIFLTYFVFAMLLNSVGTVILQVQITYGVTESAASVLEAFKDLPIAITSFLVASFLTRIGYRNAMLAALAFVGLACLLMPLVPSFWMAKLMFAATGASFAVVKVSVFATLALVTRSKAEHLSLMNFLESFFMLGVLCGYFVFSYFVSDDTPASPAWLNVYYVLAAMSFGAFALLAIAKIDESPARREMTQSSAANFVGMLALCLKPLVFVFLISAFLYVLIEQGIMSWLPTFNSKVLNLSPSLSIQMASILAAAIAIGRFSAGILLLKIDWYRVLVSGLVIAAVLVVVTLLSPERADAGVITSWLGAPATAFLFPLIGLCIAPIYPAINSAILSALPAHQHAAMAGLIVVFSALGGTSGSLLTGLAFELFGGRSAFLFSLLPIALIIVSLHFFRKLTDRVSTHSVRPIP